MKTETIDVSGDEGLWHLWGLRWGKGGDMVYRRPTALIIAY